MSQLNSKRITHFRPETESPFSITQGTLCSIRHACTRDRLTAYTERYRRRGAQVNSIVEPRKWLVLDDLLNSAASKVPILSSDVVTTVL